MSSQFVARLPGKTWSNPQLYHTHTDFRSLVLQCLYLISKTLLHVTSDLTDPRIIMTSLGVVLESSLEMTVIGAALLGVLCHQAIRPFEVDNRGWEMLLSYLTVAIGVLVGYLVSDDFDLADAILRTLWAAISFLAGLCGSMVIYRALFHRLSRFPGPFAARLSNLYQ